MSAFISERPNDIVDERGWLGFDGIGHALVRNGGKTVSYLVCLTISDPARASVNEEIGPAGEVRWKVVVYRYLQSEWGGDLDDADAGDDQEGEPRG